MLSLNEIILKSIAKLIQSSSKDKKLEKIYKAHQAKLHFIPIQYRVFGGVLQSMNIQFGNFIEELMSELVRQSGYEILALSGTKNKKFQISSQADSLIDQYITKAQSSIDFELEKEFAKLKSSILADTSKSDLSVKHDIDLLFKDEQDQIYYVEIKYNDDHDTGKFIDINRKFLKSYVYLVREFSRDITPILFYFNNKKLKGNIYLPEQECIYRGERFFSKFLKFDYKNLQELLINFAQNAQNIAQFNELYTLIMKKYNV